MISGFLRLVLLRTDRSSEVRKPETSVLLLCIRMAMHLWLSCFFSFLEAVSLSVRQMTNVESLSKGWTQCGSRSVHFGGNLHSPSWIVFGWYWSLLQLLSSTSNQGASFSHTQFRMVATITHGFDLASSTSLNKYTRYFPTTDEVDLKSDSVKFATPSGPAPAEPESPPPSEPAPMLASLMPAPLLAFSSEPELSTPPEPAPARSEPLALAPLMSEPSKPALAGPLASTPSLALSSEPEPTEPSNPASDPEASELLELSW